MCIHFYNLGASSLFSHLVKVSQCFCHTVNYTWNIFVLAEFNVFEVINISRKTVKSTYIFTWVVMSYVMSCHMPCHMSFHVSSRPIIIVIQKSTIPPVSIPLERITQNTALSEDSAIFLCFTKKNVWILKICRQSIILKILFNREIFNSTSMVYSDGKRNCIKHAVNFNVSLPYYSTDPDNCHNLNPFMLWICHSKQLGIWYICNVK